MSSALVAACAWLALSGAAPQSPPLRVELLLSPTFAMEPSVRSLDGLSQVLFLYDEALSRRLAFDEDTPGRRALGIGGRLAKLALVDAPVEMTLMVTEHEVFGHGARAREVGVWPSSELSLPLPYQLLLTPHQPFNGSTEVSYSGRADADLPIAFSGIEANGYGGHLQFLEGLRRGELHYAEAMHALGAWAPYFLRWVNPRPLGAGFEGNPTESGDLDSYVRSLAQRFDVSGPGALLHLGQRLRVAYFTSFADPTFWASAWQLVVRYLVHGERWSAVPQLSLGGASLFPMLRFGLSPFGAEHTVGVVATTPALSLDLAARFVSTGLAPAVGVGGRLFRWTPTDALELGASVDLWLQPELLPSYRNAFDGRLLPGVSATAEATWFVLPSAGLVAQLGAKSSGYVTSQPLAAGLFGFAGVTFRSPR